MKLTGLAYSESGDVSIAVTFNGTQVHNGTVSTVAMATPVRLTEDEQTLASWDIDTSVEGNLPLVITVTGGDLHFNNIIGNYVGGLLQRSSVPTDDGTDTKPSIVDGAYVVLQDNESYFWDMNSNTVESDGKTNISITPADGDAPVRDGNQDMGDWSYLIKDGQTFSCDFQVNTAILEMPVYSGSIVNR